MHLIVAQTPQVVLAPAVGIVSNYAGASMALHHGVYTTYDNSKV